MKILISQYLGSSFSILGSSNFIAFVSVVEQAHTIGAFWCSYFKSGFDQVAANIQNPPKGFNNQRFFTSHKDNVLC